MNSRNQNIRAYKFEYNTLPSFLTDSNIKKLQKQSPTYFDDDTKDSQYSELQVSQIILTPSKSIQTCVKRKERLSEIDKVTSKFNNDPYQRLRNSVSPNYNLNQKIKSFPNNSYQNKYSSKLSPQKQISLIEENLDYLKLRLSNAKESMFQKKKQNLIKQEISLENKQDRKIEQRSFGSKKTQNNMRLSFINNRKVQINGYSLKNNPYIGQSIYYVSELIRAKNQTHSIAMQHLSQSIKVIKGISNINVPRSYQIQEYKLNLKKHPSYQGKKTIVFDLDQTIIHCSENIQCQCDVVLTIKPKNETASQVRISIRPYALTFLQKISKQFELIIFTASESCYANVVLDYIDPQNKLFQHRLYRQHCTDSEQGYIKDLRIINRPLSQIVLVDNSTFSYCLQLQNAIPIFPYYQGNHDYQFKALQKYLMKLKNCQDVREINKNTFKLHLYNKFQNTQQLINSLYE